MPVPISCPHCYRKGFLSLTSYGLLSRKVGVHHHPVGCQTLLEGLLLPYRSPSTLYGASGLLVTSVLSIEKFIDANMRVSVVSGKCFSIINIEYNAPLCKRFCNVSYFYFYVGASIPRLVCKWYPPAI